jgi:hypothetical protein
MLRVRRGTYLLVADCSTVAEVAQHVDPATLVPEGGGYRMTFTRSVAVSGK